MSITTSVYAPFGVITLPPDKPEITPEARRAAQLADQVGHFDLVHEWKLSEDDVSLAQRSGLLPPTGDFGTRPIIGKDGYQRGRQVIYSRSRLAERKAALQAFVQRLK